MRIGLRVDVDTFRGTRGGVPSLCDVLSDHGIRATFFFSLGPDNMGRHLRRLLRPAFLAKMLRSGAPGLYGWDILLRGTMWPGPVIGDRLAHAIHAAVAAGHEAGIHGWDHHAWQTGLESMSRADIGRDLGNCMRSLSRILGRPPSCSAVPGWKCNDSVLLEKESFGFACNSDCRGYSVFRPVVEGKALRIPQVPVTLPTYDEVMGRNGVTNANYNDFLLSRLSPSGLNVLAIHAEVEGIICRDMFARFLREATEKGWSFEPLGGFVDRTADLPECAITAGAVPGREGWVACQAASRPS